MLAVSSVIAANPVEIRKNDTTISLGEHIRYFDDPEKAISPEKAFHTIEKTEVKQSNNNVPNLGFSSGQFMGSCSPEKRSARLQYGN